MIRKIDDLNLQEETIILEKIQLGGRKIYPLIKLSLIHTKSSLIMAFLDPLAWFIREEIKKDNEKSVEEYLLILDKEYEENGEELLNYFDEIRRKNP